METCWTIYCHTCTANGKKYVGQTTKDMKERWNQHVWTANRSAGFKSHRKSPFPNAIRKYGRDGFTSEILEKCSTQESANLAELKWISHFDSTNREKGYNVSEGGAWSPFNKALQTRLKLSKAGTGRTHTEETRQKMSESQKRAYETGRRTPTWKGKKLSDEHIAKISLSKIGKSPSEETRSIHRNRYKGMNLSQEAIAKRTESRNRKREEKLANGETLPRHPSLGRPHTAEALKRIRESSSDPEIRARTKKAFAEYVALQRSIKYPGMSEEQIREVVKKRKNEQKKARRKKKMRELDS